MTTWPSASSCLTPARAAIDVDDSQTPLRSLPLGAAGHVPDAQDGSPQPVSPCIDARP